jgi:hypothetical protein
VNEELGWSISPFDSDRKVIEGFKKGSEHSPWKQLRIIKAIS